jgi:hypothetical protein
VTETRPLNDYEQKLIKNVRDYGCQVVSVSDAEGESISFSYSVGFWETVSQPEVIILGLRSGAAYSAIIETLRQCHRGLVLRDGQWIDGLMEDVVFMVREVDRRHLVAEYFNSALWYHRYRTGTELAAAVQLVWPDGAWPWEPGATDELLEEQPALYNGKPN